MGMSMELVRNYVTHNKPWLRASEIMGRNFFGVGENIQYFNFLPSERDIDALSEIRTPRGRLISEKQLIECRDTHILVAMFKVSILNIRFQLAPELFSDQEWYEGQSFAKECGAVGWQLVRKTPVDGSLSRCWDEQQRLLNENEEIPSAQVVTYTTIGHFKVTGDHLFGRTCIRCPDLSSKNHHVFVGHFDIGGLKFDDDWNDTFCRYDVGVASVLK